MLLSWAPVLGLILGVFAVASGVPARKRFRRGETDNDRGAFAGIVLGTVAIVIGAAILIWLLYLIIGYQVCIGSATDRYKYSQC